MLWRENVGAARQILLDDVVLGGALKRCTRRLLLIRGRDVKSEQPSRRRIYCHGGVHGTERDALDQRAHVAQMGNRYANLSHFTLCQRMIAVVSGLRGQIEGDRKPGLPLGEVAAIERI